MAVATLSNGLRLAREHAGGLAVVAQLQIVGYETVTFASRQLKHFGRRRLHGGRDLDKALGASSDGDRSCCLRNVVHGVMDEHNKASAKIALRPLSANESQPPIHAEDVGREGHVAAVARIVVKRAAGTEKGRCRNEGEILVRLIAWELGIAPEATFHEILTARTDGHGSLPDGHVVQA